MQNSYQKAVEQIKKGEYKNALTILNQLIQEEPKNPDYYSERGVVYFHLKNKMKSIRDMDCAVTLQPDYSYRYASRAFIKDWIGDLDGAIKDYEKAVKLDPEDAIAYNNLGMLQEKKGYKQKANHYYDKADQLAGVSERHQEIQKEEAEIKVTQSESITLEHEQLKKAKIEESETENKKVNNHSKSGVIKKIFSDKNTFKEFMRFIRNGFRIKNTGA